MSVLVLLISDPKNKNSPKNEDKPENKDDLKNKKAPKPLQMKNIKTSLSPKTERTTTTKRKTSKPKDNSKNQGYLNNEDAQKKWNKQQTWRWPKNEGNPKNDHYLSMNNTSEMKMSPIVANTLCKYDLNEQNAIFQWNWRTIHNCLPLANFIGEKTFLAWTFKTSQLESWSFSYKRITYPKYEVF